MADNFTTSLAAMFDKDGLLPIYPAFSVFESGRFAMRDCDILSVIQGMSVTASARPVHGDRLVPSTYWAAVKDEFRPLMCSNDEKYRHYATRSRNQPTSLKRYLSA